MQIEFERSVIATFLFADMSRAEDIIRATELREEWFTTIEHKRIIHAINHLKITGFYDELTVHDYLIKNGSNTTIVELEQCLDRNIAGSKSTLDHWISVIKSSIKNLHEDI